MSAADFLLVKPLKLDGAVTFSRASEATYFDAAGVLQTAPQNTLRVTYDPSDLSKAPYALIEPEARNMLRYSEQFDNAAWGKAGGVTIVPAAAMAPNGQMTAQQLRDGINTTGYFVSQSSDVIAGTVVTLSVYVKLGPGDRQIALIFTGTANSTPIATNQVVVFDLIQVSATIVQGNATYSIQPLSGGNFRCSISIPVDTDGLIAYQLRAARDNQITFAGDGVSGNYIWGGMLTTAGPSASYIRTVDSPVTRAADVIGAGAGLLYSSVPITEALWAAGTYALGVKVRDAQNFVFESLVAGNTAALTDKTKWLPLGMTNRLKMFDKAVNSQTTAPDALTVVVKAGQLANTLTLLNAAGAQVTVTQSESGYSRQVSMVSHNVTNWYDFYYQEPQWTGDVTFGDVPPYINSLLTVHVKSPGNQAALGGFFFGKAKFIGTTQWGLKAGILSYSGEEEDEFGNVTLMPRESAKKMNFDVSIPRGYEDEVYRFMRAADNIEMVAIASTDWSMTQSYGYLGQWEVPLGIDGEKMPVEWRGLI